MIRYVGCLIFAGVLFFFSSVLTAQENLFSQNTAAIFAKQAQELYRQDPLNSKQVEQSMTLLDAALELDESSIQLPELILDIGASACFTGKDYTQRLSWALEKYAGNRADLEIASEAVKCMLEHLNSRQDRESMLENLFRKYDRVNEAFASELATQLGLLAAEKADMQAAIQYLSTAYQLNNYNQLAFIKLQELTAGANLSVTPEAHLIQLRTAMDINPYDLTLAGYYANALLNQQLYDWAEKAYDYQVKLYKGAYADKLLPDSILVPWLTSCYLSPGLEQKCAEIANQYRRADQFNLTVEALVGKAAAKSGKSEQAKELLQDAGQRAEKMLQDQSTVEAVTAYDLAWYYSFAFEQPEKALAWSNRAFQQDPNENAVRAIFAYNLAQSGQNDLAKEQAQPLQGSDQIASLTMAIVSIAEQNKEKAIENLKSTVAMAPYSFAAQKALELLKNLGSEYILPLSVESSRNAVTAQFGKQVVPDYVSPEKRFTARLMFGGSEFFYGSDFAPRLVIENTSASPLVITEGAFFTGNIKIDAVVSGDLNTEIPNLVKRQFKPSKPILAGENISIPLNLQTGALLQLLKTYPQASVKVEFTVYLDPIEKDNTVINNLKEIPAVKASIQRPGVVVTRDFLMQRLEALSKGQEGQRFRAVELLAGLLAEQKAFSKNLASYQYTKVEQTLLVDTVRKALLDENWKIRVQTMDSLMTLAIPLEFGMVKEISQNLTHENWPVRLMALLVLAKAQPGSFDKVLEWTAQYDPYWLNRRLAIALSSKEINLIDQGDNKDPNTIVEQNN